MNPTILPGYNFPIEPFGDPDKAVILQNICGAHCTLPACNNNCGKNTGSAHSLLLKLANFGPYTAGGWDVTKMTDQLGCNCISGLCQLGAFDPYGCKIQPWGCQLIMCYPENGDGNYEVGKEGFVDFGRGKLQVWKDGAEVAANWVAPDDCLVWVLVTAI